MPIAPGGKTFSPPSPPPRAQYTKRLVCAATWDGGGQSRAEDGGCQRWAAASARCTAHRVPTSWDCEMSASDLIDPNRSRHGHGHDGGVVDEGGGQEKPKELKKNKESDIWKIRIE